MKIYSTVTPSYEEVGRKWLVASVQSVEPCAELTVKCFPEIGGSADFQSEAFRAHNIEKNLQLVAWIRENQGEVILVTDSDILYFKPFLNLLRDELGEADIALAQESVWGGYNIGQMVIRCSEFVAKEFETVGHELAKGAWDQEAINRLLGFGRIRSKPLSRLFPNTGIWDHLSEQERLRIVSFHATATAPANGKSSIEIKHERFDRVTTELQRLQALEEAASVDR